MDLNFIARPSDLCAREAVAAIRSGKLTVEALVRSCLDRIQEQENTLKAWVFVDGKKALARAQVLDRSAQRRALHGLPIGVKDVIETADMPTTYGAPYYKDWRPIADAACVTLLKRAGAIIIGKTTTPELACGRICPTANPWNPIHTAGGSSAGSCAAVAAKQIPLSLGTQSAGSLIRPASYNGVVGFKPTFGAISVAGFKYFNGSFDTIGLIARNVDDVALLWEVLLGLEPAPVVPLATAPRIGLCRTPWWLRAEASTHSTLETAAAKLGSRGATIVDVTLPPPFEPLIEIHEQIQAFEAARSYAHEYATFENFNPHVRKLVEAGFAIPYGRYREFLAKAEQARALLPGVFAGLDAVIAPSAPGEAPASHDDLGNSALNRPWTLLYTPCVNMPGLTGPAGLPIGFQLTALPGDDDKLLSVARWVEERVI